MSEAFDDRRLVQRLLAHEERAFTEFFDCHFARLYRFASARLRDEPEATKEVVQTTLSKALRKLHTYRGEAALFTWLCTICRNEVSEHIARTARDRRHVVLTEDFSDIRAAVEAVQAPAGDDPYANARQAEASRLIQVALDALPSRYGNVLEWKYVYGYTADEIAAKLDLGPEAVRSLIARAKRAFREVYVTLTEPLGFDDEVTP